MSSPGFFRSGVTWANLNLDGKMLSDIDKLARCATRSEKSEKQDFTREVGMKFNGGFWRIFIDEDFGKCDGRKRVKRNAKAKLIW